MKLPRNWPRQAAVGVLSIAMPLWATAQGKDDDEEIFELSPFTVEGTEGTYRATSTLAGSRIRSDLSDIGSSISVLTEQLLEDLGATDAGSVLTLVPNMEVAGELGNYSSASIDQGSYQASGARANVNATQRVRGLANAQTTRNYFETVIPFDTYNSSDVTINRGPNSVLFGLGSPGGVIENSMSMPMAKDQTKIQLRMTSYGGHRESVDVNRVFADGRVKFRVALLNEDKKFRQEEAFEDDRRAYGAWDIKLRDASGDAFFGDTSFKGYLEKGDINRISPDPVPPSTSYQFWYDISQYQNLIGNYPGIDSVDDISNAYFKTTAQGGQWYPNATVVNTDRDTYDRTRWLTPAFIALAQVYDSPNAADSNYFGYEGYMPRIRWGGARGTQDAKFTLGDWDVAGFSIPTLMNRDVFDFVNHLFYGDTDVYEDEFEAKEFTLVQEMMGGDLGFEFSYNSQNLDSFRYSPYSDGRARRIAIDVSQGTSMPLTVPTTPKDLLAPLYDNPFIGRPAMAVNNFDRETSERDLETYRATAYFKHDFNKSLDNKLGSFLGTHTLSALYQDYSNQNKRLGETLNWQSDDLDVGANNILNNLYNNQRRQVNTIVYVGDSVLGTTSPDQVRFDFPLSKSIVPVAGEMGQYTYWDHAAKQVNVVNAYPLWVPNVGRSDIGRREVKSEAYILQSDWLDDHLVTLFALRDDAVRNFEIVPEGRETDPVDGSLRLSTLVLQDASLPEVSDQLLTKSFVLKFPEKYLFELPFDADLRFHYFESETFEPRDIGRRLDGSEIEYPNGSTEEYGFSVDLFQKRLSLRTTWYETGSNAERQGTGLGAIDTWAGSGGNWLSRALDFEQLGGTSVTDIPGNEDGHIATWDSLYEKILTITPQYYRDQITVNFDRSLGRVDGVPIDGLTSTFDYVSKGMEFEVTGSITDNWNIMFNASKQETVKSNILPGVLEFAEAVEQNLIATGLAGLSDSPANNAAGTTFAERWEDTVLFGIRGAKAEDGQKSPEQRKWRWNLVNSYKFTDGALSGLTLGAVARWQDEVAVGYPVIENANGNIVNDIANPYFGPTEFNGDVWISYDTKLREGIDWKIQLNVRNLIGGGENDFVPISIDPLGNVQAIRTSPERQILLTNTFKF